MCGIAGIVSRAPYAKRADLDAMRDALAHRGPDGCGSWWSAEGTVGLAHRRLAILDLSPAGAQPMISRDGNLAIVFNGEIYNHAELRCELMAAGAAFTGTSDTEVLLQALDLWGIAALGRLSGMFAFAIHDRRTRRLLIARDRAGEKPLYWTQSDGTFAFASELKGVLARTGQRRVLSSTGLDHYLAYGAVAHSECIIEGVGKLPPAHYLELDCDSGVVAIRRYWNLPEPECPGKDEDDLVDSLHELLRTSVRRQLVADVPVGILLSGGIDSSLVTALAAGVSPRNVRTFTVGFAGHERHDERPFAKRIADHFGTEHVEMEADGGSLELLGRLARQFDEPMCDSSMIPSYLVCALVRQHCTVALGGDGSDELFGGYRAYQGALRLSSLRRMIPSALRPSISALSRLLPLGFPRRNGIASLGRSPDDSSSWGIFFDQATRARMCPWLAGRPGAGLAEERRPRMELFRGVPGAAMAHDFHTYLADDILVKVDRTSMLNSLELRAPFLDPAIIEFAFRDVPNRFRTTPTERKMLPRRLAKRLLPADHDLERKQGFTVPLGTWLSVPATHARIVERIAASPLFDPDVVRGLFRISSMKHTAERCFALMLIEEWRDAYQVGL